MLILYASRKTYCRTCSPEEIYSLTFDVDEFSGLFLHPSIFSIIQSRSA